DERVDDGFEWVDARLSRVQREPVGGREDAGGVGGAVACRQAQLDGLARGVEADEVHPGRRPGPNGDHLEVTGIHEAWVRGDHPASQVARRSRWAVALLAAMPLEEERVERVEPTEQGGRLLDEPAEQHDP